MVDELASDGSEINADVPGSAARPSAFHTARPSLSRGFDDYQRADSPFNSPFAQPAASAPQYSGSPPANPNETPGVYSSADVAVPPLAPPPPRFWEKQPYSAIAHVAALCGAITAAWLLGLMVAQIAPGNFAKPPLQEALLRKSSRLTSRLWHFPQLWQSPTAEIRIEAIPLPETGPVLTPIDLPPLEKQPLIDELNSIETEVITLDRRLQALEERLGRPPYRGTEIESRINSLRAAIDPPPRPQVEPSYDPVPQDPSEELLEVAKLKIILPSDALFAPGQSAIKDAAPLDQVLDQLVNYPESSILIRSYSDNQAGAIASRDYTLAQASALSDFLETALPGEYRWVALGGGQSQPVASNDDAVGRQRNRRIEIFVDTR